MIQDLRQWLSCVEQLGELVRIDQAVDPIEEMGAVTYLVARQSPSPAVLFERPTGFESSSIGARLLWNILGPSMRRTALTLEEPPDTPTLELIRRVKDKMQVRIPPEEVSGRDAPVYEHTLRGDEIDLTSLPFPKHWPLDGGRYAGTADAVITRDPDTGYLNVGTYRMMIHGPRQCGLYLSPGKDARLHITRAWQRGESIQVGAAWGIDPLFMVVGSQTFPKNLSEYEFAGGIKGEPIPVVRGQLTDLLLPANAELVIEGEIRPGSIRPEGPFGEFTGYYGRRHGGALPLPADPDQRAHGRLSVVRAVRLFRGGAFGADLVGPGPTGTARDTGCVLTPGRGWRVRHDGAQPRATLRRPRRAGASAGCPGPRRGLLHEVDHRRRRGRRSDGHGSGGLGDGIALQSDRGHRHPAQYLEYLARSDPESARGAAV